MEAGGRAELFGDGPLDFDAHLADADAAGDEGDLDVDEFMAEFDTWKS